MSANSVFLIIFFSAIALILGGTGIFAAVKFLAWRRDPQAFEENLQRETLEEAKRKQRLREAETERIRAGKPSWAGRFFGAVFFLIGFYVAALAVWEIYEIGRGQFWTKTECAILSSSVGRRGSSSRLPAAAFQPFVKYSYNFDGREFTGSRIDLPDSSYLTYEAARGVSGFYSAGAKVDCYVNHKNPSEAVLDRSPLRFPFFQIGLGFLMTFGLGGYLLFVSRRRKPKV